MKPSVQRARDELVRRGLEPKIVEFSASTRTAAEAAQAVGTTIERIVKSLVFLADGDPVLVLASGANRVDPDAVARHVGARTVARANADQVRGITGYSIGGVPPVALDATGQQLRTLIDADLLQYDLVWAAAGTPNAVFPLQSHRLAEMTKGEVIPLAEKNYPPESTGIR